MELLPDVIATYTVKDVWDSGAVNNICGYGAFIAAVHDKTGVRYHNALQDGGTRVVHFDKKNEGCYGNDAPDTDVTLSLASRITNDSIQLGQHATMTVLHADGGKHDTFNENSIVVRLDLGTTRVLLMGDSQAGNRANPSVAPTSSSIEGVLHACCVINATNVQSGALWRFSKPYMWDWRVGKVSNPTTELAVAVGASSAFPPVLSPARLKLNTSDFVLGTGADLQKPPFTEDIFLTDGGVYDNLGLETAWKVYDTVLVSDGGGKMQPDAEPHTDWVRHAIRINELIDNQVRSLRKRQVIGSDVSGERKGTY